MGKILVVAAHPDDELLGIGGTVAKHVRAGDEVHVVIMCEGESLRYKQNTGQTEAIHEAAAVLGIAKICHLGYPDQKLDTFTLTELIAPLEDISGKFQPDTIYCQSASDANRDHKILFEAASIAFRPTSKWIRDFFAFYTASSTEWGFPRSFVPDTWIDISSTLDAKIAAFEKYVCEIRPYPHPRSSEALRHQAHFWGNQCCLDAAEPLMTVRRIVR